MTATTPANRQFSIDRRSEAYWRVTFSNPPINLLNPDTIRELQDLLVQMETDDALKVVVFDSADPDFFIAHYDVSRARDASREPGPSGYAPWIDVTHRLGRVPVLSVAAVRGRARGVGSEFALACDICFASLEKAVFGQPEAGVGLIPGGGALERLPQLVGRKRALEIVLGTGDFDAALAERYGWINRAVPDAQLESFVEAFAQRIARFERHALRTCKALINRTTLVSAEHQTESSLAFRGAFQWPGTQRIAAAAMQQGLGTRSELEMDFGEYLTKL
jgi:enoyl-CoA hydratase/carnithine racemase